MDRVGWIEGEGKGSGKVRRWRRKRRATEAERAGEEDAVARLAIDTE